MALNKCLVIISSFKTMYTGLAFCFLQDRLHSLTQEHVYSPSLQRHAITNTWQMGIQSPERKVMGGCMHHSERHAGRAVDPVLFVSPRLYSNRGGDGNESQTELGKTQGLT